MFLLFLCSLPWTLCVSLLFLSIIFLITYQKKVIHWTQKQTIRVIGIITGRHILDSIIIVKETNGLDSRMWSGIPGVLCKLDIEKPYKHVNWDCLQFWLERFGFGEKQQKLIWNCISTIQFSIIVYSNSDGFFKSLRGLRQGKNIFVLTFCLTFSNYLATLSSTSCDSTQSNVPIVFKMVVYKAFFSVGVLLRFKVGGGNRGVMEFSHFLFTNDTKKFSNANPEQLGYPLCLLICFEAVSSLEIN